VTATIAAAIIGALGGVGTSLPATLKQQDATVTRAASAAGVPTGEQRRLPGHHRTAGPSCAPSTGSAGSTGGSTEQVARDVLRRVPGLEQRLRAALLKQGEAVRAVDRGYRTSCS
jgi:hypothetical protein